MKPQEPDPRRSPESRAGRGEAGRRLPRDPRAQRPGLRPQPGHAAGWAPARTPRKPRRAGPGQCQGAGPGCAQGHPSQRRPMWVQCRPLPWSQILIRTRQREVSDPQPSLAPWPPWGPCHMNEEGAVGWVPPRGPAQLGPSRTPSLSWHLLPAFTPSPHHCPLPA